MFRTREDLQTTDTAGGEPVAKFSRSELIAEIASEMPPELAPDDPDEFTARRFSLETGRNYNYCKLSLDEMVRQGKLTCRYVISNGRLSMAYRKTQTPSA